MGLRHLVVIAGGEVQGHAAGPERDRATFGVAANGGALPPPLAGEGWGEGVSTIEIVPRWREPPPGASP
jgi:hypothetical protein